MQRYILIRLFHGLIAFLGVTILIFSLVRLSGDPLDNLLGEEDDEATAQYIRELWGLERPLAVQYFTYMGNLLQGEFGLRSGLTPPPASSLSGGYQTRCCLAALQRSSASRCRSRLAC